MKNVHFEVCPTSSNETGGWSYCEQQGKNWKNHPAKDMLSNGLNVGFNSDDPAGASMFLFYFSCSLHFCK